MRRNSIFHTFFLASIILATIIIIETSTTPEIDCSQTSFGIAVFEVDDKGTLPKEWQLQNGDRKGVYWVDVEGENAYLRAEQGPESSVRVGTSAGFRLQDFPCLSWQWRARTLPSGGREDDKKLNDSAAGVYVVFDRGLIEAVPKVIKYVWSSSLEKGKEFASPSSNKVRILVLESGKPEEEKWLCEKVNVYDDYKRLYKEEPPKVKYLAVMTDADDTKSYSAADYDDFEASKEDKTD